MKPLLKISILFLSTTVSLAAAADLPRVVFLSVSGREPLAENVVSIFEEHLKELDIAVETTSYELEKEPRGPAGWMRDARSLSRQPGVVAVFGYLCGKKKCSLFAMDPANDVYANLSAPVSSGEDAAPNALTVAVTAREALLGPLFPELKRLVDESGNPSAPSSGADGAWLTPPAKEERRQAVEAKRSWLWLDGGYLGDWAYPDGHPIHGPWIGLMAEPTELLGVMLSVGWLGIRRAEEEAASVRIHRLLTSLSTPLMLPFGPARVSLAPTVRLDVVFADIDHAAHPDDKSVNFELQVGGMTIWHLPLSHRLEIVVGAGLLASVISEQTDVYVSENREVTVVSPSTLRLTWMMGIAWGSLAEGEADK